MKVLICGSLAYDTIMVYPERFRDHILPEKVHMLNVAFVVPEMRREFGGCAGNIAYNLKMLGGNPWPMGTVGQDFRAYREHFRSLDIPLEYVLQLDKHFTAQAFITTDIEDNQISAFHPGAMAESWRTQVRSTQGIEFGIIGPDSHRAMVQHSEQFQDQGIPHIFDPGQALPLFDGDSLRACIERARYVCVNDYEAELVRNLTDWDRDHIASQVDALIVTRGAEGSTIYRADQDPVDIAAVPPADMKDPTGCGDAYRGGILYGLGQGADLETACQIGSLMGSYKIGHVGPQGHSVDRSRVAEQFEQTFGKTLP